MTLKDAGDYSQPRVFCPECGAVEYCFDHQKAEFPPGATQRALLNRHKKSNCSNRKFEYRYGTGSREVVKGQ